MTDDTLVLPQGPVRNGETHCGADKLQELSSVLWEKEYRLRKQCYLLRTARINF